jgi:hypothetical protein
MSIQTTLSQFDLIRLQSERMEDEFYNSNSTTDRLKRACETADLPSLCECMEAEDFVNDSKIVEDLLQSYKDDMSEEFLTCIQVVLANGCTLRHTVFTELCTNKIMNNDIIYYILTNYDLVNKDGETIFDLFNTPVVSSFKRYFIELLNDGKIDIKDERWKTFLQDLINNCPKYGKSLTKFIETE